MDGTLPLVRTIHVRLLGSKFSAAWETQYLSARTNWVGQEIPGYAVSNLTLLARNLVKGLDITAGVYNVFDKRYTTAAQLGATAFDASGRFVARPFAAPVIDGERPLLHASFQAPGAPRSAQFGIRLGF